MSQRLTFGTARATQHAVGAKLDPVRAPPAVQLGWSPLSGPAFLCDCGALRPSESDGYVTSGHGFEINCSRHHAPPLLQRLADNLAGVLDDTATHRATGECCEVHLPRGLGRAVAFLCATGYVRLLLLQSRAPQGQQPRR
jgi:hypothetical protein